MKSKPAARLARAEPIKTLWRTTIRPTGTHRLRPAATAPRAPAVRRALARAPDQQEWVAGRISVAAPIRLIDRRWRRRSCAAAQLERRPVPATPYTLGVRAHRAALTAYLRSSRVRSRSSPERRATIGLTLCKSDAVR